MQVQTSHSHFKRDVNVHRGDENVEAPNECVESQLKVKNDSVLSKHIQSKHQAFFKKLATRAERLEKKFGHPEDTTQQVMI